MEFTGLGWNTVFVIFLVLNDIEVKWYITIKKNKILLSLMKSVT